MQETQAGDARSVPRSGRSSEGGNGNPLQYSCLESPMKRGAWHSTDYGVTRSRTWLSNWATHTRLFSVYWPLSHSSSYVSFSRETEDGHRIKGIVSAELRPFKDPFWAFYPLTFPCVLLARECTCTK